MSRRQEKVSELILRELATLINQKVSDPRVRGVHIVSVDVSPDFHLARVFYSFLGDAGNAKKIQAGLDSAKPFLRKELKKVLLLRVLPELAFFYDPSIKEGDSILDILNNLNYSSDS
jgi:ribosome-binding factor A